MNKNYLFPVRDWNKKHFASEIEINDAFMKGLILRSQKDTQYGSYYTYTTKEGVVICTFYKDSTFGFGSQAYGIEVPAPYELFPAEKAELNEFCAKHGLATIK